MFVVVDTHMTGMVDVGIIEVIYHGQIKGRVRVSLSTTNPRIIHNERVCALLCKKEFIKSPT